jgi:antibiotic biosynthesis monooxygenase (ABM) superfamily enzyme
MNLPVDAAKKPEPIPFWTGGVIVRASFLIVMAVITARVASPQLENFRSLLETPSDLLRVGLGFTVCLWLVANIFILPKDTEAYRTWLYLGPAILPLSLLCAYVAW